MKQIDHRSATFPSLIRSPDRPRPWSVSMLGALLLFQAVALLFLGLYYAAGFVFGWQAFLNAAANTPSRATAGMVFIMLAVLASMAALGFWRVWRRAWLYAMLVQGMNLLLAIILHFRNGLHFAYGMMVFGIFMVLYLHYYEVRATFDRPDGDAAGEMT